MIEKPDRLTAVEERSKSNTLRLNEMRDKIGEIEKRQDGIEKLASSVAVLADRQEHVETDVKEIKQDVKNIAAIPGKRWESVVEKALMLLVGALITYVLTQIGL